MLRTSHTSSVMPQVESRKRSDNNYWKDLQDFDTVVNAVDLANK